MPDYKSNFWDERFSTSEYVYGTEPNQFFKEELEKIKPIGKLLLPGEGEGRNGVFAARHGWKVYAYDQSSIAKKKAQMLAAINKVKINYSVTDLEKLKLKEKYFDCAAIIFLHLQPEFRNLFYKKVINSIKINGKIILELFSKNQLGKESGGPQNIDMLSSTEQIKNNFKEMKIILLKEEYVYLNEGDKHSGEASVIRFVGERIEH